MPRFLSPEAIYIAVLTEVCSERCEVCLVSREARSIGVGHWSLTFRDEMTHKKVDENFQY